jgi:hypothetical protein
MMQDMKEELAERDRAYEDVKRENLNLIATNIDLVRERDRNWHEWQIADGERSQMYDRAEALQMELALCKQQANEDKRSRGQETDTNEIDYQSNLLLCMQMYNKKVNCSECKKREKNRILNTCKHMFCNVCLKKHNKCPTCKTSLSNDVSHIAL